MSYLLGKDIANGEANERGGCFHQQRLSSQSSVVRCPDACHLAAVVYKSICTRQTTISFLQTERRLVSCTNAPTSDVMHTMKPSKGTSPVLTLCACLLQRICAFTESSSVQGMNDSIYNNKSWLCRLQGVKMPVLTCKDANVGLCRRTSCVCRNLDQQVGQNSRFFESLPLRSVIICLLRVLIRSV